MKIDGHYDPAVDIAWLRFEDYGDKEIVSEQVDFGLRDLDASTRRVVGLEYWQASQRLPQDLLAMLPAPPVPVSR